MNYNRQQLRATAVSVKKAWQQSYKTDQARNQARYDKALREWEQKHKADALARLTSAIACVKKGLPVNEYDLRNSAMWLPPSKPSEVECCTPTAKILDGLVELLDTVTDDQISSNSLSAAGFKDLSRILRRPC